MPAPKNSKETGGRLTGEELGQYMESLADRYLKGHVRCNTIVTNIRRSRDGDPKGTKRWVVSVRDSSTDSVETVSYDRIVLCTGVSALLTDGQSSDFDLHFKACTIPRYPPNLSPDDAQAKGFRGPVFHSMYTKRYMEEILDAVHPETDPNPGHAIVIGGGKSGWEYVVYVRID